MKLDQNAWYPIASYIYVLNGDGVRTAHLAGQPYSAQTIYVREMHFGSFVLVRVDGSVGPDGMIKEHDHKIFPERPKTIVAAMKLAEKKLGAGGQWGLSSQLQIGPLPLDGYSVNATINSDGLGSYILSAFAAKDRKSALDNHMHDFSKHKTIWDATKELPAAFKRVVAAAKCECKEIEGPKKKGKRS